MAGRQDGTPLAEASLSLGLSPEAARKRLQRGTLEGYKVDNQWYVVLPRQDAPSGHVAGRQDADRPTPVQPPPVTPAEVARAIEATAARYITDFAGLYDRISADVGARYQAEIAAKDETIAVQAEAIAELRRRAEMAEPLSTRLEAESFRQRNNQGPPQSAQDGPGALEAPTPDDPGGAPAAGLWARVRRLFGGE